MILRRYRIPRPRLRVWAAISILGTWKTAGLGGTVPLPSFLVHFSIRAPAEQQECGDDEETADDGGCGEFFAFDEPVGDGDDEDGEAGSG